MASSLSWQRRLRRWHRAVAMLTSVQLLLWTISGIYFAFVDIDYVRGHQYRVAPEVISFDLSVLQRVDELAVGISMQGRLPGEVIVGVQTREGVVWRDVQCDPLAFLTQGDAIALATARTVLKPDRAEWIESEVSGSEFRGGPLPLWKVWESTRPEKVAYIDAVSGDVIAVRHSAWRWWDFLWSLHIMSYEDRDTIGTWLLKIFSVMALLTAILGLWLYRETRRIGSG